MARIGNGVTMVVRAESQASYPERLQIESSYRNFTVPVARNAEVPAADVLWIAVKATQLEVALKSFRRPDAVRAIIPLLNAIDHLTLLRERYGVTRVIAATIAVESEGVAPGHIVHRSPFARLNMSSEGHELLAATLDQLHTLGFECRFIDDEPTLMWSKLVFLAPIALATSAAALPVGGIMGHPRLREQWEACVREACAVAKAELAQVDGNAVIAGMAKMPADMRSSMQKDVERGNAPELDAIAGPILRGGRRHGIDVAATQALVAAVEARSVGAI